MKVCHPLPSFVITLLPPRLFSPTKESNQLDSTEHI